MQARRKRRAHPGRNAVLVLLALMVLGVWMLSNMLYVVETVTVEGNAYRSAEEVIKQSGIRKGESLLALRPRVVEQAINADRYLHFEGLYRNFPSNVILRVSEVMPSATLTWLGMLATLDAQGVVLEHLSQIDLALGVPVVTGMQVEQLQVGAALRVKNPAQLEAMQKVLEELRLQQASGEISELNVAELDNLYLVTQDGIQVQLGDANH
ncbi:MAG: FtsQ-type POTRA domain-containing protein, partial [Clostridia bacterium]